MINFFRESKASQISEYNQANNNTSSALLINDLNKKKTLIDEANNFIQSMKRGEYFQKIINEKGRKSKHLLILSQNEDFISVTYNKCLNCKTTDDIYLDKISSCEIGYSNNIFLKKKFENYLTIVLTNNKCYEFYNQTEGVSKQWVNGINYLIQKKNKKTNSSGEIKLNKEEISNIWQKEIIPNWPTYRKYIHDKNKEAYFTRKQNSNKKRMDKNKNVDENIEILQANHEEILYLWTLGLPSWLRRYLWNIVIVNELEITENLFQGYKNTIFKDYINYKNIKNSNINRISKSTYCTSYISNNEEQNKINLIRDITNDIDTFYQKNEAIIKSENKTNFKEDIYVIVSSFCFFRLDILYDKQITQIASFLYLNTENNYDAFRILCNLVIPSYLFDFLQNDVEKMKNYCEFFERLMQKYIPFLYNYCQSINFSIPNLFYKWARNIFLKAFNYNTCLLIFDNFIIKGKIFIYQVALAILMIKQKDIINSDYSVVTALLKKNQLNIDGETLFAEIEKVDIREEYKEFFDIYSLGKEKIELFQDL